MTAAASGQANRPILGERYELVSRIGAGASAQVFHAVDLRLDRQVAIKHLRPDFAKDPRFLKLFRAEAHLAAQLSHPNVVAVYDWSDESPTGPFIVTELLSGGTLRHMILGAHELTISQVTSIGLEAAQGLAFAHEQGLVHRDVKPANLLFGQEGRVRVADFGIARAVAEAAWTEPEGVLIGTARYAAPEQATDGSVDGLADVYSLALCMIEAVTGEVPLLGDNALSTMSMRQKLDVPAFEDLAEALGPLAAPLAGAGLADPDERSSAAELLEQLMLAQRELPDAGPLPLLDVTVMGDPIEIEDYRVPGSGAMIMGHNDGRRADDEAPTSTTSLRRAADGQANGTGSEPERSWDWASSPIDTEAPTEGPVRLGWSEAGLDNGLAVESARAPRPGGPLPEQPRRSRWRPVLFVLVGLLVALAGAAAVFGPGLLERARPETTIIELGLPRFEVSDFQALEVPDIRDLAEDYGWSVVVSEDYQDGTVAGEILRQSPEPGARLAPGEEVMVVISLGPELRIVPNVVGSTLAQAQTMAADASLSIGQVTEENDEAVDAGVVLEAVIGGIPAQPGAEVVTGTTIDVVISSGPTPREVPNLVGLSVDQARSALADLSLAIDVSEAYSETVPEGQIISSDPGAEEVLARGSSVAVVVSLGLPFVEIPDVTGMLAADAATELEALGLVIEDTDGPPNRPVLITDPVAGTSVRQGTAIRIIVSR